MFLKDHVTLSNDAENSALHHRNKLHFKLYWTVILNSNNISQYYRFTVFLIKYIQTWWAKKKKKKKKAYTYIFTITGWNRRLGKHILNGHKK